MARPNPRFGVALSRHPPKRDAGANRAVLLLPRRITELNDPDLPSHRGSAIVVLVGSAIAGAAVVAGALIMTEGTASLLQPRGVRAEAAAWLHWFMFALGGAVMALIIGLLAWAVLRSRPSGDRPRAGVTMVVLGGIVLPAVVLPVIWAVTIGTMAAEARPDRDPVTTIEVAGYQWYYEVECPDGETALNEMHIPVGEPVRIRVTSGDVVHSFWVPELAGKQDMVPGEWHEIWIEASEPGEYLALCGEFCGLHHAGHQMVVYAGDAGDCGPGGGAGGGSCCG